MTSDLTARLKAAEAELASIRAEMEKPVKGWKPDKDETYWYLTGAKTEIGQTHWQGEDLDLIRLEQCDVFHTREAAEKEARITRTWRKLRSLADGGGYGIFLDYKKGAAVSFIPTRNTWGPTFSTEAKVHASIDQLGLDSVIEWLMSGGGNDRN